MCKYAGPSKSTFSIRAAIDRCVSKIARSRVRARARAHAHRGKPAPFVAAAMHRRAKFSAASDAACTCFQMPAAMQPCPDNRTCLPASAL